jgi:hypothetical protein
VKRYRKFDIRELLNVAIRCDPLNSVGSEYISLAENEEQRAWMDKIWPYQDDLLR